MNFFAHYYFHHKPNNSWNKAGLLFPDLLRIFTKEQRISEKSNIDFGYNQKDYKNLIHGIQNHFRGDEIFHNWDWFKEKNHELAITIRESKLGIKRDWFLAHIFIELTIDHVLVNENKTMVKELYADLMACDKLGWELFFNKNKFGEFEMWYESFDRFNKNQYIFTYKDTYNIIYALNRICQSIGIGKFDDNQNQFLLVLLNDFIPQVKLKINELRKILE